MAAAPTAAAAEAGASSPKRKRAEGDADVADGAAADLLGADTLTALLSRSVLPRTEEGGDAAAAAGTAARPRRTLP
jgi:hypothetical protein